MFVLAISLHTISNYILMIIKKNEFNTYLRIAKVVPLLQLVWK